MKSIIIFIIILIAILFHKYKDKKNRKYICVLFLIFMVLFVIFKLLFSIKTRNFNSDNILPGSKY